jgi:hypothetical protein
VSLLQKQVIFVSSEEERDALLSNLDNSMYDITVSPVYRKDRRIPERPPTVDDMIKMYGGTKRPVKRTMQGTTVCNPPQTVKTPIHKDTRLKKFLKKGKNPVRRNTFRLGDYSPDVLGCNAMVEHALSPEPNPELLKEILGVDDFDTGADAYIPQIRVRNIVTVLNLQKLLQCSAVYPGVAVSRGIEIDGLTTISSGDVGTLYLMYVTIFYDLYIATQGQISIFDTAPDIYWRIRATLGPREAGGYFYSFSYATGQDDFAALLALGIPTIAGGLFNLAWKNGVVTPEGENELFNGIPAVVIDDILTSGTTATANVWAELFYADDNVGMVPNNPPERYYRCAAAFANPVANGKDAYRPWTQFVSEIAISSEFHWIMEMGFAIPADRSGVWTYPRPLGAGTFSWRVVTNTVSYKNYMIKMKQIPITSLLGYGLTEFVSADLRSQMVKTTGGSYTQDIAESSVYSLEGGQWVRYYIAVILKKYALNSIIGVFLGGLTPDTEIVGAGMEYYVDYQIVDGVFPTAMNEAMADLSMFKKKSRDVKSRIDVYVPVPTVRAPMTGPNVLDNNLGVATDNVNSVLTTMYPNITLVGNYLWKPFTILPLAFNFNKPNTMVLDGPSLSIAYAQVSNTLSFLQGNLYMSGAVSNVHGPTTLDFYTQICDVTIMANSFDSSIDAVCSQISNEYAFDPNQMTDTLPRPMCALFTDFPDPYFGITGEVASLSIGQSLRELILPSAAQDAHERAGEGNEKNTMDTVAIEQGKGGGFMDVLKQIGKVAIPVASALADSFAPGTGALVNGIGGALVNSIPGKSGLESSRAKLRKAIVTKSGLNPYARVLRPISSGLVRSSSSSQATFIQDQFTYG